METRDLNKIVLSLFTREMRDEAMVFSAKYSCVHILNISGQSVREMFIRQPSQSLHEALIRTIRIE